MKNNKLYFPLIVFTAIAAGFILGGFFVQSSGGNKLTSETASKRKLNKLIDFINNEYVDNINTDSVVDQTVNGILEKLDPHSVYIAKNESQAIAQNMKGNFVGIGVNFFIQKDTVVVITPVENGPSAKAGIKAGDRILAANNERIFGKKITTDKIYSKLKGEINSEVILTIFRKSENKSFKIKILRNTVPIKSIDIATIINKTTGYIKINRFAETTYDEFKTGLSKLIKENSKSIIIDLRDNGGGYLDQATAIADEFLKKDKLIVLTKNKKGRIDKTFATTDGTFETGKVSILINENTASASEILAGAIQDNDRGYIIGRRSFGKGLVQREMPFEDGSLVRLTVARYYTPTGRSIQKSYKKGHEDYFNEFIKRYQNGELYAKDSIKIADTLKFKTPMGRIVYGGGGIVPDFFVGLDTPKGNEIIPAIMQSGAVTNFVFETIDKNRTQFKNLTIQEIKNKVNQTDLYFNAFKAYINESSKETINLNSAKEYIKKYITAEFCHQILGENEYYQMLLKDDNMINEALKH